MDQICCWLNPRLMLCSYLCATTVFRTSPFGFQRALKAYFIGVLSRSRSSFVDKMVFGSDFKMLMTV